MSAVSPPALLGGLVDLNVRDLQGSRLESLGLMSRTVRLTSIRGINIFDAKRIHTAAFEAALRKRSSRNSALFFGQRHWETPEPLAWAWRPGPPLNRRNGTATLWAMTPRRNFCASRRPRFLMAWAVSRVFCCQENRRERERERSGTRNNRRGKC